MIDPKNQRMIEEMSYLEMLDRWRFAPVGDPLFIGELGQYFADVMRRKRREAGEAGHVSASKTLGWGD